jgi:NitT/TauT family transport system substrate-binding protein
MARNIWILAVGLILSLIFYINYPKTTSSVPDSNVQSARPIVIGYSNWPGWWPWAIAESEGLFAKHGLQAELKWYDDYTKSMEDLSSGYIDGNCQTLNDTITFANKSLKGETVVLVNDNSAGNDKIIAASEITNVSDLQGKKVAVEAGVVDDFLLTLALKQSNLTRQDVTIVDAETGAAAEAFLAGQVDAVGAFPPFWLTALKRDGAREIISSKAFPGAIPDLLVVTQELVDKQPERVQSLVEVWFDILDFIDKHPREANQIMTNIAGVSDEEFKLFQAGTKMFFLEDNLKAFKQQNDMSSLYYAAEEIEDFLNTNLLDKDIKLDFERIFSPQFVRSVSLPTVSRRGF